MHIFIQNLEVKNLRCMKDFKRHEIKNHSNMFRIVCDPSSGSIELYLTEITRSASKSHFEPVVCVHTHTHTHTHTHHWFKITLPNTDQAHDKHLWRTTNNFSQVQLYTSWWWIAYDPKHVGMIFNLMYEGWNFNSGNYFIYNSYKIETCFEVLLSFNVVTSIVYNLLPAMWKS